MSKYSQLGMKPMTLAKIQDPPRHHQKHVPRGTRIKEKRLNAGVENLAAQLKNLWGKT